MRVKGLLVYPYRVEQASVNFRWMCPDILAALPIPGSTQFRELARRLQPFDLEARTVTVDTPSNRLSDVVVTFGLQKGEIRLLFSYTGFEIQIDKLLDEHLGVIPELAQTAFSSLQEFRIVSKPGTYQLNYHAHLALDNGVAKQILREHLSQPDPFSPADGLEPDALAYRLPTGNRSDLMDARVVLARSLLLKEGLFADFSATYTDEPGVATLSNTATADVLGCLGKFGLHHPSGTVK